MKTGKSPGCDASITADALKYGGGGGGTNGRSFAPGL